MKVNENLELTFSSEFVDVLPCSHLLCCFIDFEEKMHVVNRLVSLGKVRYLITTQYIPGFIRM